MRRGLWSDFVFIHVILESSWHFNLGIWIVIFDVSDDVLIYVPEDVLQKKVNVKDKIPLAMKVSHKS